MAYDDQEQQITTFLTGLLFGAVIGAGLALLSAPESGRRTRRKIVRAAGDVRENTQDRIEDFADDVKGRVDDAVKTARKRLKRP
jgi:gas vesicle protein